MQVALFSYICFLCKQSTSSGVASKAVNYWWQEKILQVVEWMKHCRKTLNIRNSSCACDFTFKASFMKSGVSSFATGGGSFRVWLESVSIPRSYMTKTLSVTSGVSTSQVLICHNQVSIVKKKYHVIEEYPYLGL